MRMERMMKHMAAIIGAASRLEKRSGKESVDLIVIASKRLGEEFSVAGFGVIASLCLAALADHWDLEDTREL